MSVSPKVMANFTPHSVSPLAMSHCTSQSVAPKAMANGACASTPAVPFGISPRAPSFSVSLICVREALFIQHRKPSHNGQA